MKISGKVVGGKGKGKRLGFPTANILLEKEIESGIYAGSVMANNKKFKAGIFVSPDKKLLEVHLIGFSGDLYDKEIEVEIGKKIREVMKFESDGELKRQIKKDIKIITRECGANEKRISANDLVYPELSYKLVGLAMEVHNELGNIYQEKHYQKLFEERLKKIGMTYEKEKQMVVKTKDNYEIGEFFADFIVDNKILLEFKRVNYIHYNDIKQVMRYLDATGLKLGIIINFKLNKLQYKRIVNPRISSY